MTDNNSESAFLSKAEASTRYNRLITLTERVKSEDEFYELYFGVARNVLESFPIASNQETSAAVMPEVEEVSETMPEMLPAPSTVFSDDYFGRPTYAIKVLHAIALFYRFGDPSKGYLHIWSSTIPKGRTQESCSRYGLLDFLAWTRAPQDLLSTASRMPGIY
eukprot:IDg1635t1